MRCPRCSAEAHQGAAFCHVCGLALEDGPAAEPGFQLADPDVLVRGALEAKFGKPRRELLLLPGVAALIFDDGESATIATVGLHTLNQELTIRAPASELDGALEVLRRTTEAALAKRFSIGPPECFVLDPKIKDVAGAFVLEDPELKALATPMGEFALLTIVALAPDDVRHIDARGRGPIEVNDPHGRWALAEKMKSRPGPWWVVPGRTHVFHARKRTAPAVAPGMSRVKAAWARIEAFLEDEKKGLSRELAGPAPEEELEALERQIGAPLPDDVRESWRIHDGEGELSGLLGGAYRFLTAAQLRRQLEEAREAGRTHWRQERAVAHGPVRADGWNDLWIPLTDGEGRYYLCVDLDPPPEGRRGQIIAIGRFEERSVNSPSWADYLDALARELEEGALAWDEEEGGFVEQRVYR